MIKQLSIKIFLSLLLLTAVGNVQADEGMWLISDIDSVLIAKMKALGLKLEASQIYNEKQPDIRSAIAMFDNGCSGEFVSSNGLLFTNHHCGRDRVQQLSSDEKNYIRVGYWANQATEELPVKGLTVKILIESRNLTLKVNELLKKNTFRKVMIELEKQYSDSTLGYTASLDAFSDGRYFVSVYQTFKDVRLVGIPPESVGNFGGENDNFEWPRQSADFAVFRVYANSNNLPAAYAPDNRPYEPKAFLPISLSGVKENDFTMTIGYPFATERYINSYQLKEDLDVKNRATALAKGKYVEVVEREMNNSESVHLKYSSKNFSAGNSYKLAAGLLKQVQLSSAFEQKKQEEEELKQWIQADTVRQKKYGNCLTTLEKNYALQYEAKYAHALLTAALFSDASVFGIRAKQILTKLEDKEIPEMNKAIDGFRDWHTGFAKNYDAATDQKIVRAMLKMVRQEVPQKYLPGIFKVIDKQYKGDIDLYADNLYSKSIFTNSESVEKFLKSPKIIYRNDPLYIYGTEVYNKLIELKKSVADYGIEIRKAEQLFTLAMREKNIDKHSYPDANFTMRLTYGTVSGANPRDGITYKSQTTLQGVIEKEETNSYDYYVWPQLKQLFNEKNYGGYAEKNNMYTCFLSTTDIIGGNSGSPVINAKGELTGIAFDGVRESLAGTYIYESEKNRSVNVDVRYVLFIIDKFAKNTYIMNELKINKSI
jgi:hypothetical protein